MGTSFSRVAPCGLVGPVHLLLGLLVTLGPWPCWATAADPRPSPPPQAAAPVTLVAVGNQLLVITEDPQALALVQALVRQLNSQEDKREFTVLRLKHAVAADAAKVLDELFNGPVPQGARSRPFAPPGGPTAARPREQRVRVVADAAANALLLSATPADLLTIHRLLDTVIDKEPSGGGGARTVADTEPESGGGMRTWVLPRLRYAGATEVAAVLRSVYHQQLGDPPAAGAREAEETDDYGRRVVAVGGGSNESRPRPITLSIGIDERTNRIIVACSEQLKESIAALVEQLDEGAKDAVRTVRVVPLRGVDPALIKQAVEAIQGHSAPNGQNGSRNDPARPGTYLPLGGRGPGVPPGVSEFPFAPGFVSPGGALGGRP